MSLKEHIPTYYFDRNYNCSESVLRAANDYYQLGIADKDMIMAAGFGAGMQTGNTCGAVLAAISVLSLKYVEAKAHESEDIKPYVSLFLKLFKERLNGSIKCSEIKPDYFAPEVRCLATVEAACDALEETMSVQMISVDRMRRNDAWTIEHLTPSKELMHRAGEAIFRSVEWKSPVAIVCGKGNNAGDGYVAASFMKEAGIDCRIILTSDQFSEDGRYYFDKCVEEGIPTEIYNEKTDLGCYGSILDCLLGTGFRGEVRPDLAEIINKINSSGAYVVSADINSGLNCDTGEGETYVHSDMTVSIGSYKYGHFIGQADKAMENKVNCDIGIRN